MKQRRRPKTTTHSTQHSLPDGFRAFWGIWTSNWPAKL